MAKRFILNETSYHGHGAVNEIVPEVKSRGFKKALIVTDADLVKFQVVKKSDRHSGHQQDGLRDF